MANAKPKLTSEEMWLEKEFGTKVEKYKEYKPEDDKGHKYWISQVKAAQDKFKDVQASFAKAQKIKIPPGGDRDVIKLGETYFQTMGEEMRTANNDFRAGQLERGMNALDMTWYFAEALNDWADAKFENDKLKKVKGT